MKIVVLDDYQDVFRRVPAFARLKDHDVLVFRDTERDPAKLAQRIKDADVVVLTQQRSPFPRAVIEKLPRLKLIAQTGSHRAHIDIAACIERGIIVAARGGGTNHSTVELTWALILASMRHLPHEVEHLRRGGFQTTRIGEELYGKTLGIYALGRMGSRVARVGEAFGMNILCWGREATRERAGAAGYAMPATRAEFFGSCDIISLHMPLNEQTLGIVKAGDFAQMKATALFVNTSRARLVEDGALCEALRKGRPGFAAVDVFEEEPVLGGKHPLLTLPNALCTPHLGLAVRTKYETYYGIVVESILGFAQGKPVNVFNPEVLSRKP